MRRGLSAKVTRPATIGLIAFAAIFTVMVGEAKAGCGDGACGRVDWSEVTDMDQGAPAAVKLHGAYAWEASPDFWATHPVGGTFSGYFWMTCRSPAGTTEATCRQQLATEMSKTGTDATITFGGNYFNHEDAAVVQPVGLYRDGEQGHPISLATVLLGASPVNPEVCRAALALPRNGSDAATGGAGGGSTSDASTGGTAGGGPVPSDDGGCSTSGRGSSAHPGFAALAFAAAMVEIARRRSHV